MRTMRTAHGHCMPTQTVTEVDFHLPLPWFLDIDLAAGHMVANTAMTEGEMQLSGRIANVLAVSVQQFRGSVQYPADRWSKWGTPAARGQLRRFIIRVPEEHTQQLARLARLVFEQVLATSHTSSTRAVIVTKAGDESAELY